MDNAELRRQQRRAENASRSRPITQVATIGQRANNGRYNLIAADGGLSIGKAEKIYSAKHDEGDTVIALPRRDGVILLEGPKATPEPTAKDNPLALAALVDRCDGYINGQIFNCGVEKRVLTIAWAIGRQGQSYSLLNLITGEDYILETVPATVPPCAAAPPDFPAVVPPEPLPPDAPLYLHVWDVISWGTPVIPRCSAGAPVHPLNDGNISSSTINLKSVVNGTDWVYRTNAGTYDGFFPWNSTSLSTYTYSPTPPPIDNTAYAVISNALGYSDFDGFLGGPGQAASYTYVSIGCAPVTNFTPPVSPPIDSRNPNGTPIPNVVEATVSIGQDLGPIGFIRHTPNCVNPSAWNSEKSYTLDTEFTPFSTNTTGGRLTTDWRYGDTFACRDEFKAERFINISPSDRAKLQSIEPNDRPATLTPGTPTQVTVTEKTIAGDCTTTIVKTKEITATTTGNLPFEILSIAVLIQKR